MPTAGSVRVHRASTISDAVPRRIARASVGPLRVQSVYRSVVNIGTADGLLTIASTAGGGLPNGVLVDLGRDWRAIGLHPGMAVIASDAKIHVPDAGLEVQLTGASRWSPRLRTSAEAADAAATRWGARNAATRTIARARASAGGFGPLLGGDDAPDPAGYLDAARPLLARLILALESGDRNLAGEAATGLIGLGQGLTPSGDDVLVGIEAALRALARPTAGFLVLATGGLEERTTALAATLLRHAAAGEFAERVHVLLAALLGSDDEAIPAAIDRAVAWGATSGTDCLLGLLIGLDVAAGVDGALA